MNQANKLSHGRRYLCAAGITDPGSLSCRQSRLLGCTWERRREWVCLLFCCLYKIRYREFKKEPRGTLRALFLLILLGKVFAGIAGRGLGEIAARQPWQRESVSQKSREGWGAGGRRWTLPRGCVTAGGKVHHEERAEPNTQRGKAARESVSLCILGLLQWFMQLKEMEVTCNADKGKACVIFLGSWEGDHVCFTWVCLCPLGKRGAKGYAPEVFLLVHCVVSLFLITRTTWYRACSSKSY